MKKKLFLLTSLLSILSVKVIAQQDKLITHFIYDKMSLNPAATGVNKGICATTMYRNQWDQVNGAPNSAVLNIEANLEPRFKFGRFGIAFYHDAIGFSRQNNAVLNYAYAFRFDAGELSAGLGIGMINFGMSPVWVPPTTSLDPLLPASFSATNLDMNLGVYWKGVGDYYAGISTTHLSQSLLEQSVGTITQSYQTRRHFYAMGGKKFIGVAGGDIDAQLLVRSDLVKTSFDVNARYIWDNRFYGGLSYRLVDAVSIMLGAHMGPFTFGYSYDVTTNKLASISRGSHELMFKYCYQLPTPPLTRARHPRWL